MQLMHPNIKKLYLIAALEGIVFFYAFDKVFMQLRGLSIAEVVLIEIIFTITVLLLEVPSGTLSDRWSRKYVLALNSLFFIGYIILFALSHSFMVFALGVLLAAAHSAFQSGTDTSLLFDSLREDKKEDNYEKYLGRKRAITAMGFIGAAVIGGLIGEYSGLEAAFWWTLPSAMLAGIVALTLREPVFHRSTGEVSYWQHIQQTLKFLRGRSRFLHIAAMLTAISVPMLIFDEYAQVYYAFIGVGVIGLGLLGAFGSLIDVVFNTIAFYFKKYRHDVLFSVMFTVMSVGFIMAGVLKNPVGILLLFFAAATFYIVDIIAMADINRQLPSKIRATSESFFSFLSQAVYIPVGLGFAYISQHYSIATGFAAVGGVVLLYTLFYWLFTFRVLGIKGKPKAQGGSSS